MIENEMKWWAIFILGILLVNPVFASEDITLSVGESYVKWSVNITLAKIDKSYEKAVLCVNNEKQILEDDQYTYFKNASLKLVDIDKKPDVVKIRVDNFFGCYNCKCEGDCTNNLCRIEQYDQFGDPKGGSVSFYTGDKEPEEVADIVKVDKIRRFNLGPVIVVSISGVVLGFFLVWLFWFRKMTF